MSQSTSSPDEKKCWPVVLIEWYDSAGSTKTVWHDLEDEINTAKEGEPGLFCYTAGILIHEDEKTITVTLSVTDTQCGNLIMIPKCSIKKHTVLESIERKDDL